ncbi:MAG: hypothetical protein ACYDB8_00775 [Acidiferrobacterales bacterium]
MKRCPGMRDTVHEVITGYMVARIEAVEIHAQPIEFFIPVGMQRPPGLIPGATPRLPLQLLTEPIVPGQFDCEFPHLQLELLPGGPEMIVDQPEAPGRSRAERQSVFSYRVGNR